MRLKAVVIRNFRSYREEQRVDFGDMTTLIGRNEAGKSSILEALDIFFNAKIDPLDACVFADTKEVTIGCVFGDLPPRLVLDEDRETALAEEHLLNADGDLEIRKAFNCGLKTPSVKVSARAVHPTADGAADVLGLKIAELKTRARELGVDLAGVDQRANPALRKAIWRHFADLDLRATDVPLDSEGGKGLWEALQKYMPVYALFRADRPSQDDDSEAQDPMQVAVREALKSVQDQLEEIEDFVREQVTQVATRTLAKLREVDAALASELQPEFRADPKWDSLFKLTLTSDNQIPVNKRGSGTRRLILMSFFRAEAERKQAEARSPGAIYAIEEPETSQHPRNQRLLVEALLELSQRDGCQVIITTHVPGLAGLLPVDSIRYVQCDGEHGASVSEGECDLYSEIAQELGVIPDNRVSVFVLMEGPTDVQYLRHFSKLLHGEDTDLPVIGEDPRILPLHVGGQTLEQWVNEHYLKPLGRPEVHLYDSDTKYADKCREVNERPDGSWARQTRRLEIENYLHPQLITEAYRQESIDVQVEIGDGTDVPVAIARTVHEQKGDEPWDELVPDKQRKKESRAKRFLCQHVLPKMTLAHLAETDPEGEIRDWLKDICDTAQQQ